MKNSEGKDIGGRPKIMIDRVTVLGSVPKVYHKHLQRVAKELSEKTGRIISMSQLIRIALEAMFPPDEGGKTELGESLDQLYFWEYMKEKKGEISKREFSPTGT